MWVLVRLFLSIINFPQLCFIWQKHFKTIDFSLTYIHTYTFSISSSFVYAMARLVLLFYYFLSLIGRLVNILLWFGIQSFPHYQTIKKSMTAWDILTHSNLDLNYGHATYLATLFPPEFFRVYLPPVNPFPKVQVQCPPCFFGWVLFLSI